MDKAISDKFSLDQMQDTFDASLHNKYASLTIEDKRLLLSVAYDLRVDKRVQDGLMSMKAANKFKQSLVNIRAKKIVNASVNEENNHGEDGEKFGEEVEDQERERRQLKNSTESSLGKKNKGFTSLFDCFEYSKNQLKKKYPVEAAIYNMLNELVSLKPDKSTKISHIMKINSKILNRPLSGEEDELLDKEKKAKADSVMALLKMKKSVEESKGRHGPLFNRGELVLMGHLLASHYH